MKKNIKNEKRERRHRRIRSKVKGSKERPRLSVFKSHKYVYAQLIDDEKGVTVESLSTRGMKGKMAEKAKTLGLELAKKAKHKKIQKVVFDRSGYIYTGRVKALAEGAREGGLEF